ncbi:MAG: SDR family NAD(P)-dependent oxidoreductase [Aquabacterium sp.]|nr:SDR family NAD(P)-dependent oxidoreductase [Aquabacterium sp.]
MHIDHPSLPDLRGKTVAVTGASGMIGVYICRSLLRAGARVIGVVRNPDKAAFLKQEGVVFRRADLADADALTRAFEGCDAIVSNAAMYVATKILSAWGAHERANVEGTRHVYEAAHRAGVRRVVHISTFGVYRWTPWRPLHELSPQLDGRRRQGGPYRATKQVSETMAWDLARQYGLDLTTLRPTGVFGARDHNLLRKIYPLLKVPLLPLPSISFPFVYAGDVADAVTGALAQTQSIGQAYNVGGTHHQFADFVKAVASARGQRSRVLSLPLPVGLRVDNGKAEREIGFRSRPLRDALAEVWQEEAQGAN